MKIGILNFHRALNYGAVLQCYGLQETLTALGHEVSFFDYRPRIIEKHRSYFLFDILKEKGIIPFIRSTIYSLLTLPNKYKCKKAFDDFLSKYLKLTDFVVSLLDLAKLDSFDIIFVGSDQVWSERITGLDNVYLGNFVKYHVRYIAYAASLGASVCLEEPKQQRLLAFLPNYQKLSVREIYLQKWLMRHNFKSQVVLDPSLLADTSIFDKIAFKPKVSNYVLLINLDNSAESCLFAENIANQLQAKVVSIKAIGLSKNKFDLIGISPMEFCGLIKYSRCVITVSFHATAFSIVFQKDFYVMKFETDERSYNLLTILGLTDRHKNPQEEVIFTHINYKLPLSKLNQIKKYSLEYINSCLDN